MPNNSAIKNLWDNVFQPMLRKRGIDIQRYPPKPEPDWTETAFGKNLPASALGQTPDYSEVESFVRYCFLHSHESNSQLLQDLFVRWKFQDKNNGFFVEFGATNGVDLSNSYSLEKLLSWKGIVAEPARCWHEQLEKNRHCSIDTNCVWNRSAVKLVFNQVEVPELSTIDQFSQGDQHSSSREKGSTYEVNTISFNDLLAKHNAPEVMDYLSIDTEGSELTILESLDCEKYVFGIITVEHNYTADRARIHKLLGQRGYTQVFSQISRWDDWYVHASLSSKI